jgi:hypothetical protein
LAYTTSIYNNGTPGVQVLLGNGDGTFRTGPNTPFSSSSTPQPFAALAAGDFNGDGKLDLLVTANGTQSTSGNSVLWLFPGNGDGSFGMPSQIPGTASSGAGAASAVAGDFNGDGKLDIAYFVAQPGSLGTFAFLTVSLGNGDGTFQMPSQPLAGDFDTTLALISGPVLAGDFNGDGKLDLILGTQLFYGKGDGSFTPYGPPASGLQVIQVGDFNGDGRVDLLALGGTVGGSSNDLRLLTQVPAPPDFTGAITPTQTAVPGNSANYAGSVTALNGFTGNVSLSASGMPAGVTASFNPATVTGGSGSYTMTLSVASSVPVGSYTVTATGTSGSLTHSTMVNLIVNTSTGDFTSTLTSDNYQNIVAGQTATYTIRVSPIGGYNGDVTLSVGSGLGISGGQTLPGTATFNPSTIHGASGTSTLTITTTSPVSLPDAYRFTIAATSGPLVHSGNVFVGVSNNAGDFTGSITPSSQAIAVGHSATYTANITYVNGFTGTPSSNGFCLDLNVTGLPPGAQFNIVSRTGCPSSMGDTVTFTISAPPGTPPGTYTLLLTGSGGGRIRAGAFTLTIN